MLRLQLALPLLTVLLAREAAAQPAPVDHGDAHDGQALHSAESPAVAARRLAWWQDARFGMFIHWGLYAHDGCHWKGQDGKTEHMMRHLKIPLAEYAKIAGEFHPRQFDAATWVRVAKDAGMKYLVITSKHHDGFAMWGSDSSDYNIVARTPWKRDPIAELAAAARKAGLAFGVYYSLGRDWQDPDVPTRDGYRSNTWDFPDESKKDFSKYFARKVKPQVRELLTRFKPALLWFDTPEKISRAESEELLALIRKLSPATIVNARIGNRLGDYAVEEQKIPAAGAQPQPWETCMTLNRHWGYHKLDQEWKPADTLVRNLVDIASKGGNFLLNVGPTGAGLIPEPSVTRLRAVGAWMKVNGAGIYGTTVCDVAAPAWGRCTRKGRTYFFHVLDWPADGRLVLGTLPGKVKSARLLAGGKRLVVEGDALLVPPAAPDVFVSTVAVEVGR